MPHPRPPGAPARADAPPSALPLSSYRQLRARYETLLITLYERTAVPVRDIIRFAKVTDRGFYWVLRQRGAKARRPGACRPGATLRLRRDGPCAEPLDAAEAAAAIAAFREAAEQLRAHADARLAADLSHATELARRRTVRTARRVLASNARQLRHLASAIGDLAALRDDSERRAKAARPRKPPRQPRRPSGPTPEQERLLREQQIRMWEAHDAKREAELRPPAPVASKPVVPPMDPELERRINEIAERYYAREQDKGPRIRKLW